MSWIRTIAYDEARGRLARLYDRIKGPDDNIDNIMQAHSLRPHTMEGHMAVYKYVLHHNGNTLPKWFLEAIGVWVSLVNACDYCAKHHFAGLARLLADERRSDGIRDALAAGNIDDAPISQREKAALRYAEFLTREPQNMNEQMIVQLRAAGYDDGEILEINQVTAYFSYANRTVLGLGVSVEGDELGTSPGNNDDPADWSHQ